MQAEGATTPAAAAHQATPCKPQPRRFRALTSGCVPAPVQVPLLWTVYLMLSFRQFELLGPRDPARQRDFFQVCVCVLRWREGPCRLARWFVARTHCMDAWNGTNWARPGSASRALPATQHASCLVRLPPPCGLRGSQPWLRARPCRPCQVPPGYKLDRMEEGDLVGKKASPLLERLDSAASGDAG